jgi:hypothetical protein
MTEPMRDPVKLLDGLLGPAGPELTCEQCFELLDVYVERELELERDPGARVADDCVPGMRAHLEGCPACSEEYDSLRALIAGRAGVDERG